MGGLELVVERREQARRGVDQASPGQHLRLGQPAGLGLAHREILTRLGECSCVGKH